MKLTLVHFVRSNQPLYKIVVFISLIAPLSITAQSTLSWEVFADMTLEHDYDEETEAYWLTPRFGGLIKSYHNKTIIAEGYLIVLDIESNLVALSKYPYSSCFFCGNAGPESVIELQLTSDLGTIKTDQRGKVQGRLILNIGILIISITYLKKPRY